LTSDQADNRTNHVAATVSALCEKTASTQAAINGSNERQSPRLKIRDGYRRARDGRAIGFPFFSAKSLALRGRGG